MVLRQFALKGRDNLAQGNALGTEIEKETKAESLAQLGRREACHSRELCKTFSLGCIVEPITQGGALC